MTRDFEHRLLLPPSLSLRGETNLARMSERLTNGRFDCFGRLVKIFSMPSLSTLIFFTNVWNLDSNIQRYCSWARVVNWLRDKSYFFQTDKHLCTGMDRAGRQAP